jgi:ATP-dependent RNA helicase RhlE
VIRLSEEFLEFPVKIEITPSATTAETVEQGLYEVPNLRSKISLLSYILKNEEVKKSIIFTKTKNNANNVFKYLSRKTDMDIRVIHGNKDQNTRLNAIRAFRENEVQILVATDVVARGIDIEDISHVINFDVPVVYEDYVHRIGRTGRAKKKGKAITFCNPAEQLHIPKIEEMTRQEIPRLKLPDGIRIFPTDPKEKQEMAREIDSQKRRNDPNYKGAFHEKKRKDQKSTRKKIRKKK